MLSVVGFSMMGIFLVLLMTKKMSPLAALIIIPVVTAILAGFSDTLGVMMLNGIKETGLTGIMIIFSIMFFSLMSDAGLFDPLVRLILEKVQNNPVKVTIGTAILSAVIAIDGESTSTYLIVVAALLPLYKKLKLNPLILICIVTLTCGIMNMLPWSAPAARVTSILKISSSSLFKPMLPVIFIGLVWVFFVAYYLGIKERNRLKKDLIVIKFSNDSIIGDKDETLQRPKLIWINFLLTILLITLIALDILPLLICFMLAFAVALVINYPDFKTQSKVIKRHSGNAVLVASIIFAAGIFTGILEGTGMIQAMGRDIVSIIPNNINSYLNEIFAFLSLPFTFLFSNDAYYFGVLPVLNDAANQFNISSDSLGRASLLGQSTHLLSPLVPGAYLLASLVGVEYSDYLKFTFKWALGLALVLLIASIILGII